MVQVMRHSCVLVLREKRGKKMWHKSGILDWWSFSDNANETSTQYLLDSLRHMRPAHLTAKANQTTQFFWHFRIDFPPKSIFLCSRSSENKCSIKQWARTRWDVWSVTDHDPCGWPPVGRGTRFCQETTYKVGLTTYQLTNLPSSKKETTIKLVGGNFEILEVFMRNHH